MVREDLIDGAITFLQDPSVSNAPIEQKISFLRSKNLTQEEIDASLSRVGQSPTAQAPPQTSSSYSAQQQYRQPPSQQYGGYQQNPYWAQPPPEPPRRDWRDYFIMATVMSGVGYAMYWTAKRYIVPLIAPPTPQQLEQDKASIDASFDKAFALLDQLATDTQELKDSEKERKQRLDHALAEVEGIVSKMKEANENREMEAKRVAREIEDIKEQIPVAIQKEKESMDGRLKDLTTEMKSLKTLVGNRMGQSATAPQRSTPWATNGVNGTSTPPQSSTPETNGTNGIVEEQEMPAAPQSAAAPVVPPSTAAHSAGSTLTQNLSKYSKNSIPAWQLAASRKHQESAAPASTLPKDAPNGSASWTTPAPAATESGTVADADASTST